MGMADAMVQTLLESVPDGVFVTNSDRTIVEVNAAAAAMFGYRRDELLGQRRDTLVLRSPHNVGGHPGLDLYIGCRKDGIRFPLEVDVSSAETKLGLLDIVLMRRAVERPAPGPAAHPRRPPASVDAMSADPLREMNGALGIMCSRIELMQMEVREYGGIGRVRDDLEVLHRSALRLARMVQTLVRDRAGREGLAPRPRRVPPRGGR